MPSYCLHCNAMLETFSGTGEVNNTVCYNCSEQMKKEMSAPKKAIITDEEVSFYSDEALINRLPRILPPDSEISIIRSLGHAVEVTLPDGTMAFINSNTQLNVLKRAWLTSDEVSLLKNPASNAQVLKNYVKGASFTLLNSIHKEETLWVRIRDNSGVQGFIPGDVKIVTDESITETIGTMMGNGLSEKLIIKELTKLGISESICRHYHSEFVLAVNAHKNSPEGRKLLAAKYVKHMVSGVLWCGGGLIATAIGYSAVSERGGSYMVFWGAVLFGAYDFLRGLFGWLKYSGDGTQVTHSATITEEEWRQKETTAV